MDYYERNPLPNDEGTSDAANKDGTETELKLEQDAFSSPLAKYLRQRYLFYALIHRKLKIHQQLKFHSHIFRRDAKLNAEKEKFVKKN